MKRLFGYVFTLIIVSSSVMITGCKKGPNDPFFSIHSRKARVTGFWDFQKYDLVTTTVSDTGVKVIEHLTIEGESARLVTDTIYSSEDTTITLTGKLKEGYYEFMKDGRMTYVLRYELIDQPPDVYDENTDLTFSEKTTHTIEYRGNGTWNFLNKIDTYKNKERISLVFENYSFRHEVKYYSTKVNADGEVQPGYPTFNNDVTVETNQYANGEFAELWLIDMLKNKEMNIWRIIDNQYVISNTSTGGISTTTSVYVNGTETVNLIQE